MIQAQTHYARPTKDVFDECSLLDLVCNKRQGNILCVKLFSDYHKMPPILADLDVEEMRRRFLRTTLLYAMLVTVYRKIFMLASQSRD